MQAQDIKDSYQKLKRDITDITDSLFMEWVEFTVDFAYENLKKIDPDRFVATEEYVIITSPSSEALPDDFDDMNQTNCGFFLYDDVAGEPTETKLGITNYGSPKKGYYFENDEVVFTGISDETYELKYMPTRTELTSLTDYLTLDSTETGIAIFKERASTKKYLINAIDVLYSQWDVDPAAESLADFRFVREMDFIFANYRRTPHIASYSNPNVNF
jgi:hypothetical protein